MASATARRLGTAALSIAGTAAGAYFLDPDNGKRRRHMARDRVTAFFRSGYRDAAETAEATATHAADRARGAAHEVRKAAESERPAPNDQELAHRVETAIFRSPEIPKGSVNVNAEAEIVYLRGQVESPEQIRDLVDAARQVDGVRAVENLLHLPAEPAPHKAETEPETRRRVKGESGA